MPTIDQTTYPKPSDTLASGALTAAEGLLILVVSTLALLILTTDAFEKLGPGLQAWPILGVALGALALGLVWLRRRGAWPAVVWRTKDSLAILAVVGGLWAGLVWRAGPSLMPLTDLEDSVAHWLLVQWLVDYGHIPSDPALSIYMGGLGIYPPGFHYLAALGAEWLGQPGVRLMQPVLALLVALKFGLIYRLTARLVGGSLGQAAGCLAVALLLLAYHYSLYSFMMWSFYPQVASETFAITALWALLWLLDGGGLPAGACLTVACLGVLLTWPAWLPIVLGTLGIVFLTWRRVAVRWRLGLLASVGVGLGLFILLQPDRLLRYVEQTTAVGGVVRPSVAAFSPPLLILGGIGVLAALWVSRWGGAYRHAWIISVFGGLGCLQMAGLYLLSRLAGSTTLYPTLKIAHILIYPLAILGGALVGWLAAWVSQRGLPRAGLAWFVLVLVSFSVATAVLPAISRGIGPSGMTEDVYQVGQWAADNLPTACVEYIVPNRISRFWLHVGLLGNAWWIPDRRSGIVSAHGSQRSLADWRAEPRGMRYAIVTNWNANPAEGDDLTVRYTFGDAAVVEHPDAEVVCPVSPYPPRPSPPAPVD